MTNRPQNHRSRYRKTMCQNPTPFNDKGTPKARNKNKILQLVKENLQKIHSLYQSSWGKTECCMP